MSTKKTGQRRHAQRRARERLGRTFSRIDLARMVEMIQRGKSTSVPLRRPTNRVSGHRLTYEGATVIAVYDRKRRNIVTFLCEDMIAAPAAEVSP